MKELILINPENISEDEVQGYETREAVRAIVVDEDNKVALLYVAKEDYYKLPGGGIEESEDKDSALQRECLEEIGCQVRVTEKLGEITEYRRIFQIKQISYCYLAKVDGAKGQTAYTDEEQERGFKQVWLPYDEALDKIKQNHATSVEGRDYIVPRDTRFLQEVGEMLS